MNTSVNNNNQDIESDLIAFLSTKYGEKMSQEDAAEALNLSRAAVGMIEEKDLPKHKNGESRTSRVHYLTADVAKHICFRADKRKVHHAKL